MNQRTCGNCRWWNRHSGEASGDCQRHPPVYNGAWAVTDEVDFCGEWANKTITPKQEERREMVRRFAVAIAATEWCSNAAEEVWRLATMLADADPGNSGHQI